VQITRCSLAIGDGTATGATDYDNSSFPLSVTFNAGESSKTVAVPIVEDPVYEPGGETITFSVASQSNAIIGTQSTTTININDNDFNDITGGPGGQTVTGTDGRDRFIYNSLSEGGDRIANFTKGDDKIDISAVLTQIGYSGSDPIAESYLSFQTFGSDTIIKLDVDGSGTRGRPRGFLLVQDITSGDLNDLNNSIV